MADKVNSHIAEILSRDDEAEIKKNRANWFLCALCVPGIS